MMVALVFVAVVALFAVCFYVLLHLDLTSVTHHDHLLRRRGNLVFFPLPRARQQLLRQRLAVESRRATRQAGARRLAHPPNPGQSRR